VSSEFYVLPVKWTVYKIVQGFTTPVAEIEDAGEFYNVKYGLDKQSTFERVWKTGCKQISDKRVNKHVVQMLMLKETEAT